MTCLVLFSKFSHLQRHTLKELFWLGVTDTLPLPVYECRHFSHYSYRIVPLLRVHSPCWGHIASCRAIISTPYLMASSSTWVHHHCISSSIQAPLIPCCSHYAVFHMKDPCARVRVIIATVPSTLKHLTMGGSTQGTVPRLSVRLSWLSVSVAGSCFTGRGC